MQAVAFLQNHEHLFSEDIEKFNNLVENLSKQKVPSGNYEKNAVRLSGTPRQATENDVYKWFKQPKRILHVNLDRSNCTVTILFKTHSAARKTFEGFAHWGWYPSKWISRTGEELDAFDCPRKPPTFNFMLFSVLNSEDTEEIEEQSTDESEMEYEMSDFLSQGVWSILDESENRER
jgi:hypothetical protein